MSYRDPSKGAVINTSSAQILKGLEDVEKTYADRFKLVRDYENKAEDEEQKYKSLLEETKGLEDPSFVETFQDDVSVLIDEIHDLNISSFEGDRALYLKKKRELDSILKDLPKIVGTLDEQAKEFSDKSKQGDADINRLRSNDKDYVEIIRKISEDDGAGLQFKIENGTTYIVDTKTGRKINGKGVVKGYEGGRGLVKYTEDYSKQLADIDKKASANLEDLEKITSIQKLINEGKELSDTQIKDITKARDEYERRLRDNNLVDPVINESTFQSFSGISDVYDVNNKNHVGATREKIIERLVEDRFPGTGKYVIKYKQSIVKGSGEGEEEKVTLTDYSDIYNASNSVVNNFKKVKEIVPTQPYKPLSTIENLLTTDSNNLNEKQRQVKSEIQQSIKEAKDWASKYVGRNIKIGKQSPGQISKPEIKVTEEGIKMVVNYGKDQQVVYNLSDPNQIKTFENNLVGQDKGITLNSNDSGVLD